MSTEIRDIINELDDVRSYASDLNNAVDGIEHMLKKLPHCQTVMRLDDEDFVKDKSVRCVAEIIFKVLQNVDPQQTCAQLADQMLSLYGSETICDVKTVFRLL